MKENRRDYEEKSVNNIIFYDNDRAGSAKLELPALAIYIQHDFRHVKSRRQKRPSHHAFTPLGIKCVSLP